MGAFTALCGQLIRDGARIGVGFGSQPEEGRTVDARSVHGEHDAPERFAECALAFRFFGALRVWRGLIVLGDCLQQFG